MFGFIKKLFGKHTPEDLFKAKCDYRFMKANTVSVIAVCKLNNKQELTDEEYDNIDTEIVRFIKFARKYKDHPRIQEWFYLPQMSDDKGQLWFSQLVMYMENNLNKFPKYNLMRKNDKLNEMSKAISKDFE